MMMRKKTMYSFKSFVHVCKSTFMFQNNSSIDLRVCTCGEREGWIGGMNGVFWIILSIFCDYCGIYHCIIRFEIKIFQISIYNLNNSLVYIFYFYYSLTIFYFF